MRKSYYLVHHPPPSTLWSIFDPDPLSRQLSADLIGQRIVLRRSGGIALGNKSLDLGRIDRGMRRSRKPILGIRLQKTELIPRG